MISLAPGLLLVLSQKGKLPRINAVTVVFNVRGDPVKRLFGKCDGLFVLYISIRLGLSSQSRGPMEHSRNDVIKLDSDIVKYVYGEAVGIFLRNLIRAGA